MGQCVFQQNLDNCIGKSGNKASHGCLIFSPIAGSAMDWCCEKNKENSIEFKEPRAFSFLTCPPRTSEFDPGIQTALVSVSNYGAWWR